MSLGPLSHRGPHAGRASMLRGTGGWALGAGARGQCGPSENISQQVIHEGWTDPGMRGVSRVVGGNGWRQSHTNGQGCLEPQGPRREEAGEGTGSFSKEVPPEVGAWSYSCRGLRGTAWTTQQS